MSPELYDFDLAIAKAQNSSEAWDTLRNLSQVLVGHRLFTVMTVDMTAGLARRAYSDQPLEYPVSGTKPIHRDEWFDIVHGAKKSFIANTIEDIAKVFPDYQTIASLGCGSVVNLPVVLKGELVATINMLDVAHHYTAERVAIAEMHLAIPAKLCCALALLFDTSGKKPD